MSSAIRGGKVKITVRGGGSGIGITSIIEGTCDVADSSRAIKDAEAQKAASRGRDIKAHVIAMDGIAVIVNPENGLVELTKKQVADIYTGKISDWSGADDAGKIVVLSRDSASGTFEAFGALALGGKKVRSDALMQASNQAIASMVAKTPGGIGYVGLGYVTDSVKALKIDGVLPSSQTVLTGGLCLLLDAERLAPCLVARERRRSFHLHAANGEYDTQRWERAKLRVGYGHLYQGRFKSFPIESDEHFYTWCGTSSGTPCGPDSSSERRTGDGEACASGPKARGPLLSDWPLPEPSRLGRTGQSAADGSGA